MKRIIAFFGALSLAFAACGGSQSADDVPDGLNTNTAVNESQFANITDPNAALLEGNRLFDENQTEMAIAAFRQAVTLNPDLAEAHFKLGIAYSLIEMQMEQTGTAVTETVSNSKEGRKKTNSEKAFEKAVASYEKWLEANPKDDVAHFYLGRTYAKLAKDEEAEKAFKEAVKLRPDDAEYQTELGAILIKLAEYREAITALEKAVDLDPANVRAQELLEDAEAGRRRVDFVSPKNTNQTASNKSSGVNANTEVNSNSNSSPKTPSVNAKPKKDDPKDSRPRVAANKP